MTGPGVVHARRFGAVLAKIDVSGRLTLERGGSLCGQFEGLAEIGRTRPVDADEQAALQWAMGRLREGRA